MRRPAAAVLFVSAAALLFTTAGCSGSPATEPTAPSAAPTAPTFSPDTTGSPDSPHAQQAELTAVLAQFGAAVELAPPDALLLGDATFCGWDEFGSRGGWSPVRVDPDARTCFVEAHRAGRPAVFANISMDNEGAPIPNVLRTEAGQATIYIDWTRSLSSEAWRTEPCPTLYVIKPDEADGPLSFACYPTEGAQPA